MKKILMVLVLAMFTCSTHVENTPEIVQTKSAIELGCFGFPWCAIMDEERRLLIRKSTGELAIFCLDCSGTTGFSTDYYDYICAYHDDCDDFYDAIKNTPGLQAKVDEYCLEFPNDCVEMYPEECDQEE